MKGSRVKREHKIRKRRGVRKVAERVERKRREEEQRRKKKGTM